MVVAIPRWFCVNFLEVLKSIEIEDITCASSGRGRERFLSPKTVGLWANRDLQPKVLTHPGCSCKVHIKCCSIVLSSIRVQESIGSCRAGEVGKNLLGSDLELGR